MGDRRPLQSLQECILALLTFAFPMMDTSKYGTFLFEKCRLELIGILDAPMQGMVPTCSGVASSPALKSGGDSHVESGPYPGHCAGPHWGPLLASFLWADGPMVGSMGPCWGPYLWALNGP
jgi:hypothetical protein